MIIIKSTNDKRLVRKTRFSAGYDVSFDRDVDINPGVNYINLDLELDIPRNFYIETYTRSSTLKKYKIAVANTIIDNDYKDTIHLICWSFNDEKIILRKGEAICQLVVHNQIVVENWTNLENERKAGLGSTDIKENE